MNDSDHSLYYLRDMPVPETPLSDRKPQPWGKTEAIGKPYQKVDAYERVSGNAIYPSDVMLPNMLSVAILRCPYPHAIVEKIDSSAAEKMAGIRAVITGYSPGVDYWWPYSPEIKTKLFDLHCRFEGEEVAAIAADTIYQAWDAIRALKVNYKILAFVSDETKALAADAPAIHAGGNKGTSDKYSRGDVERGFNDADAVLEETYHSECELHTPLESHGCVARWDGDRLSIWQSTQGVYSVQAAVSKIMGLPLSKVRVMGHYMGGGFGSKLTADKSTIIAAVMARKTARPVKLFMSREETLIAAGNRPPASMRLKAGVKRDGTLTALDFSVIGTGGAYPTRGTNLMDWLIRDLYACPNVRTDTTDVFINAGPSRPFRAPGHPQCSWALEQMLDALAEKIGMDPLALRLKNIPSYSQARPGKPPYTSTGLRECIKEGAKAFGWDKARKEIASQAAGGHIRRGVGMASALWFAGGGNPPSTVIIKLFSDGSMNLNMGASDIGTGTKTVMAMVISEELGVKPDIIQIEYADTGTTQFATPSGGSKTVPTETPAVRAAAIHIKQQLIALAAQDLKTDVSSLTLKGDAVVSRTDAKKKILIVDVSGLKKQGLIVGVGYRSPNPEGKVVNPFAAQFCEVEVNTLTGEVRVLRFLGAHDSGRVMNRMTYDNQVCGGITMGIGFALTEARVLDRNQTGKMVNKNWHDYKIPTASDVPADIISLPIDMDDQEANTTGTKGLGEPVTIPTAAAIANAVYNAVGVRVTTTPITPVKLCSILHSRRKEGKQ